MRALLVLSVLLLSGCLTTTKPVFTDENSIRATKSAALQNIIATWESRLGPKDSPREVLEKDLRVLEVDGFVVVEEPNGQRAEYFAIGLMGKRPIGCFIHHDKIETIADRHGVTVEVDETEASQQIGAPILADGTAEALFSFIIDAFERGPMMCFSPPDERL